MNQVERTKKTISILKEKNGFMCETCKSYSEELTIDHIIPVAILQHFGILRNHTHKRENLYLLQLLCRRCNILKQDRVDWSDKRSKEILLKLIEDI